MKSLVFCGIFILISSFVAGQKVDVSIAKKVGQILFEREKPDKKNMQIKDVIPLKNNNDTLIYIVAFPDDGFAIISADYRNSPILGYCKQGSYSPEIMPPALNYLIDNYKYSIAIKKENANLPDEKINKRWQSFLSINTNKNLLYSPLNTTTVDQMTHTNWGQQAEFNQYCPLGYPAGCTAVAMAQILEYWNCRINPNGTVVYSGTGWLGGSANFSSTIYDWFAMDNDVADTENSRLIYHAGVSCLTHYESGGSSSTPGRARDGFVNNWGINSDADLKWRISHLSNWPTMLKDELDLGRPILYSGGALLGGGHSWVIDGYDTDGNFHCNWGWYGSDNGFYSLGDFDPDGNGPFNQYESAIFNVEPVQSTGVVIPQLMPQTFTYSPSGYTLSIPAAFGATSYEWITDKGTISGSGTTVTLFSNCSANVQVRAFNNICNIFSSYKTVLISIIYGPITGSTLVCSSGSTFTVNNLPPGSSVSSWDKSSNLIKSSQSGSNATFTANGNGNGWVNATINSGCGLVAVTPKTVWVGKPIFSSSVSGPSQLTPGLSAVYSITPATGASSYSWQIPSGCYYNYCWHITSGQGTTAISVQAGAIGSGAVQVTASNACPGNDSRYMYVNVQDPNAPCDPLTLSISPNPSVGGNVVIDVIKPPCDPTLLSSEPATLSVIDNMGTVVYSKKYTGNKMEISGLQLIKGVYHVVYTRDNKKIEKSMIVQ